jgi:hypothetical protein
VEAVESVRGVIALLVLSECTWNIFRDAVLRPVGTQSATLRYGRIQILRYSWGYFLPSGLKPGIRAMRLK